MACLQNGTTLLNNNNLSSFKHNIMKYDETHANYTSQINNFLTNQIPFRNNHTKDKPQSDKIFNKDDMHSCVNKITSDNEINDELCEISHKDENTKVNNVTSKQSTAHDKNGIIKTIKQPFQYIKTTTSDTPKTTDKKLEETGWLHNRKKLDTLHIYNDDNSYQKEFTSDKTINNETTESGEPSHHARRPMNAFLIFCKRHRTIVKNRYPHLENRAVTKILGEWWAGLELEDKACYTELAKQYKNAFFSANPNFKWYKLPAPPLRTLNTRPGNIVKSPPPPKEPSDIEVQTQQLFTPGKLADETQLGSITSLINSDNQHSSSIAVKMPVKNNNNTIEPSKINKDDEQQSNDYERYLISPPATTVKMCQPSKPLKKRVIEDTNNSKKIVRDIFSTNEVEIKPDGNIFDSSLLQQALQNFVIDESFQNDFNFDFGENAHDNLLNNNTNSNLTQQELINKVVDHMCSSKTESNDSNIDEIDDSECNTCLQNHDDDDDEDKSSEIRKSVRSCKGLRYAKFMAEGKLFASKRNKKSLSTSIKLPKPLQASSTLSDKVPRNTEPIDLSDTIKKLAERTIGSSSKTTTISYNFNELDHPDEPSELPENEISQESREETMRKMFRAADFNLDEKIEALPSLSLDKFQQKKKENKKRKFLRATRLKETAEQKKVSTDVARSESDYKNTVNLIGSRKRKPVGKPRKQSERSNDDYDKQDTNSSTDMDLFGLATLAEVAAKKAKIDQNQK